MADMWDDVATEFWKRKIITLDAIAEALRAACETGARDERNACAEICSADRSSTGNHLARCILARSDAMAADTERNEIGVRSGAPAFGPKTMKTLKNKW